MLQSKIKINLVFYVILLIMNFTKLSLSISSIEERLPRKSFEKMAIHKISIGHDSNYDRIPSLKFADKHIWKGHSTLGIRFL
jgi:hypothetical protein